MINNYWDYLSNDIKNYIIMLSNLLLIQRTFKKNRNFSQLKIGDRVMYLSKSNNKLKLKYATINEIKNNFCKLKQFIQIIPNWKNSNINFWNSTLSNSTLSNSTLSNSTNVLFPYYHPKDIKINKSKIIKLTDWNTVSNTFIDNTKRLELKKNK